MMQTFGEAEGKETLGLCALRRRSGTSHHTEEEQPNEDAVCGIVGIHTALTGLDFGLGAVFFL